MGKIIMLPELAQAQEENQNNVKQLKALVDKYVTVNKKETLDKIKKEQCQKSYTD